MAELTESVDVEAAPEHAWAVLVDWPAQGRWMLATDVAPVDGDAQGPGGRLTATTGVRVRGRRRGVLDTMEIIRWEPPRLVEVRHTGRVIRGSGVFEIRPRGARASLVWTEAFDLPLGRIGRLGWPLVRPLVHAGLRMSLRRFAEVARDSAG
jgi:hypothetical protein